MGDAPTRRKEREVGVLLFVWHADAMVVDALRAVKLQPLRGAAQARSDRRQPARPFGTQPSIDRPSSKVP